VSIRKAKLSYLTISFCWEQSSNIQMSSCPIILKCASLVQYMTYRRGILNTHFWSKPIWPTVDQRAKITSVFDLHSHYCRSRFETEWDTCIVKSRTMVSLVDECPMFEVTAFGYTPTYPVASPGFVARRGKTGNYVMTAVPTVTQNSSFLL